MDLERPLSEDELTRIRELVRRRRTGEPIAYLVGKRELWGRSFLVTPAVLVPRPETETLIERALEILPGGARRVRVSDARAARAAAAGASAPVAAASNEGAAAEATQGEGVSEEGVADEVGETRVLDLCTGSGCIAVTLACERPRLRVDATEISEDAAAVARSNAEALGVDGRVRVLVGDLFAPVAGDQRYALVVANPPYVAENDPALEAAVAAHEPAVALFGGRDGLDVLRRIAADVLGVLEPGGAVLVEVGAGQANEVARVFAAHGLDDTTVHCDLAGIERVVEARVRGA
jgi:release factor glutamine methyltransferase